MTTSSRKNQTISSSPEIAMHRLTWLVFKQICSILLTEKKNSRSGIFSPNLSQYLISSISKTQLNCVLPVKSNIACSRHETITKPQKNPDKSKPKKSKDGNTSHEQLGLPWLHGPENEERKARKEKSWLPSSNQEEH
jgi:hypothetical protein